ncbi:MAG: hypothetical protein J1G30_01275 [Spirochaetales bacterium]|nr:hypothetical protein [Spirochaetales bacterium]
MKWNKIFFNKRYIRYDSRKSLLITFPKKSDLADYYFWVSKSLIGSVREDDDLLGLMYGDDFDFTVFKENHFGEKIESKTVSGADIKGSVCR